MSLRNIFFICSLILFNAQLQAQLTTTSASGMTPQQLVQNNLVGTGVTVSNVKFNGSLSTISCNAIGTFSTSAPTNLGFTHGLIMASGHVSVAPGPNSSNGASAVSGCTTLADPQLQAIATGNLFDCATLEFDFIPLSDTIKFRYVFASEEYPEYVNQTVNDVFGFFITGMNPTGPNYVNKNIALIPGTTTSVCINNVNNGYFGGCPTNQTTGICTNCSYYVNNCGGTAIQYDGFTTVLTAWALVIPCTSYHLKMAIADVVDPVWDSGVFFEANSFSSPLIAVDTTFSLPTASNHDAIEGCNNITLTFKLPYPAPYPKNIQIKSVTGTATNGVDYPLLPNMLIIPTGSDSVQLVIAPIWDHTPEPTETIVIVYQEINSCYPDTLRFNILNYDSLTAVAYGDTTLCDNTTPLSVVAQHGITPYQYNWSNGAGITAIVNPTFNATTQYNITVKDACLKTVKDSVMVTVYCDFARAGPDTTICLGGTANLNAFIDTNAHHIIGTPTYLWSNGSTTANITVNPTVTTTYIVTITDVFTDKDTVIVHVNPIPTITASALPAVICYNDSAMLQATGGVYYNWTANITDLSLFGEETLSNPIVSPKSTTIYTVVGSDSSSCSSTASVTLFISSKPNPVISVSPNPVSVFDPVVHVYDKSGENSTYFWSLGDGTTSVLSNFYHTYSDKDTGRYLITVTATNAGGCTDTASIWVIVRPDGTFYVPNAFTPDGDGLNDLFKAYGIGILEFEMSIYDRWGKQIYHSKNMNEGWDGRINGDLTPSGTFSYIIVYKEFSGIRHTKSGAISVIR